MTLKVRFEQNPNRHKNLEWSKIEDKLRAHPNKIVTLLKMEQTAGEPDVVGYNHETDEYIFFDCSPESPKDRRSVCYDHLALEARKTNKPKNSAINMADEMGIKILTEAQYMQLQQLGQFDTKTSTWLQTPDEIRQLGGAIFGDRRYNKTFIFHNGAESYFADRGFRGSLKL